MIQLDKVEVSFLGSGPKGAYGLCNRVPLTIQRFCDSFVLCPLSNPFCVPTHRSESGLQFKEEILPYLLNILRSLLRAHWVDSPGSSHGIPQRMIKGSSSSKVVGGGDNSQHHALPPSECFSFALNTLLTDIAARDTTSSLQVF